MANGRELLEKNSEGAQLAGASKTRYPIRKLIILLLVIEALALGMKFLEERRTANANAKALIQREALAVAEHISGEIKTVQTGLQMATAQGQGLSSLRTMFPKIEVFTTLDAASKSLGDERLQNAANRARELVESNQFIGISQRGDLLIIQPVDTRGYYMAITTGTKFLPQVGAGESLALRGKSSASYGETSLSSTLLKTPRGTPQLSKGEGFSRIASSCTQVAASPVDLCSARTSPIISVSELGKLLMFAFLIAAPALAIFGLLGAMRKQAENVEESEQTREESTKIIDLVMDGARAGYWEWDAGAEDIFVSPHMAKLLDAPIEGQVPMSNFLLAVHSNDRDTISEALQSSVGTGQLQVQFRSANSQGQKWFELDGRYAEHEDGTANFTGICSDVTERKHAEYRQRAAESRMRNAIDGFSGPFAIWDSRRRLIYWNYAFEHTFNLVGGLRRGMGYDAVTLARGPAVKSMKPADDDPNAQLTYLTNGDWMKLVERQTPQGGLITVGVDITETMKSQLELKKQKTKFRKAIAELERSEGRAGELARKYSEEKTKAEHAANAKGTFLANMSHELRTPLNAINGFSEILVNELYGKHSDERYKGYAQDILTSGEHLLDMINDILDMAKIEAGKMSINPQKIDPVDPVDAAVRMIRRRAEDKGIAVEFTHDPDLPDIEADPRAIRQMVLNLVSNAIKFTDAGGKITVQMQGRRDELRVAIIDTGVGIPPEHLPRLARPFEQVDDTKDRNKQGTGLGLALTKSFAEMHGGRMTITSEVGKGTTVSFFLPMEAADQSTDSDQPPLASNG